MSLSFHQNTLPVGFKATVGRLCTTRSVQCLPAARVRPAVRLRDRDYGMRVTAAAAPAAVDASAAPAAKEGWWQKDCPTNMKDIQSVQELVDELAANKDRLVVVDFYASWCHSCRSMFPKLKKLVGGKPEVLVLKVNFDDNKQMCKTLGIKVLPYFHMYKGSEGRVESFTASINKIQRLKDALEVHGAPFCSLGSEDPTVPEFPDVKAHADAELAQGSHSNAELLDSKTARQTVNMNSFNSFPAASTPAYAT